MKTNDIYTMNGKFLHDQNVCASRYQYQYQYVVVVVALLALVTTLNT